MRVHLQGRTNMYLNTEKKRTIFQENSLRGDAQDTGSPESQVALFTHRIAHLTEHLKQHRHDKSTELSLLKLVGKRRRLLNYLSRIDIERYRVLIKKLGIRR